jgi:hypothetical protein
VYIGHIEQANDFAYAEQLKPLALFSRDQPNNRPSPAHQFFETFEHLRGLMVLAA